jgi:AcrR family transcriptional regulator
MTKRPSKRSETRLRILAAAADLLQKQGVQATSPDDIIEASNTGKGQFYHYFKNKEGLMHEIRQSHLEAIRTGSASVKYDVESREDLEHWFVAHLELQKRFRMTRGCPFGTIGNGLTGPDDLIRQNLSLIFEVVAAIARVPALHRRRLAYESLLRLPWFSAAAWNGIRKRIRVRFAAESQHICPISP